MKMVVAEKSMSPLINIGDKILIEKTAASAFKIGEIIVFKTNTFLIVHRIVGKFKIKKNCFFIHKGDKSFIPGIVKEDSILGKVIQIKSKRKQRKINSIYLLSWYCFYYFISLFLRFYYWNKYHYF